MNKNLYPLKLSSIQKNVIWGGKKLCTEWGKTAADPDTVGESWMLSVREKEVCTIENGSFAGKTMWDYISANGTDIIAKGYSSEKFPLLIKLLDANDTLSVQVHPDDDYAARVENDYGKTEMWYIVEADEGASLVYGLADGVSPEDFRRLVESGETEKGLKYQPVKAGEVYFIPSGLVHAIGKGILIAEVQQNSDLTYRVFDFNRRQKDGSLRELHIEKALDVIKEFSQDDIDKIRFEHSDSSEMLVDCKYFAVKTISASTDLCADEAGFHSLICLKGEGKILYNGVAYEIKKGDSYYIPAGTGEYSLELSDGEVLFAKIN